MDIKSAIREGLKNCQTWSGGAVIVMDQDHDFTAIPGAYLDDISYSGSRHVVYEIGQLDDYGDQVDIDSESDMAFIIGEMIMPNLDIRDSRS
jgi:hypothetical protein